MVRLIWPEECVHETCNGGTPAGVDEKGFPKYGGSFCTCHCHDRTKAVVILEEDW